MRPTSTIWQWFLPVAAYSDTETKKIGRKTVRSIFFILSGFAYIFGENGFPFGFSFHVSTGPSSLNSGFFDTIRIVTCECGKYEICTGFTAELTFVIIKVNCHGRESHNVDIEFRYQSYNITQSISNEK